jgi:hypothetical protein
MNISSDEITVERIQTIRELSSYVFNGGRESESIREIEVNLFNGDDKMEDDAEDIFKSNGYKEELVGRLRDYIGLHKILPLKGTKLLFYNHEEEIVWRTKIMDYNLEIGDRGVMIINVQLELYNY